MTVVIYVKSRRWVEPGGCPTARIALPRAMFMRVNTKCALRMGAPLSRVSGGSRGGAQLLIEAGTVGALWMLEDNKPIGPLRVSAK
jgi:hypothetical protein